MFKKMIGALGIAALAVGQAHAAIQIEWWHAMGGGTTGEKVQQYAQAFNESQDKYEIKPVYKGTYTETMTSAIAAFRAGEQPAIVQVFEVGTATMMAAKGAVYPVHQLMADAGVDWDPSDYLDAVKSYYTTPDGKLLSLPFNSSTPVLFYNKDVFEQAGLDPNNPPSTWAALEDASRKIIDSGTAECGFTTGWQSWVQLENFGAWHNHAIATRANGFEGLDTELKLNDDLFVDHIRQLKEWQDENIFAYGGRRGDPNPLFYTGECAMLMNSSAYYGSVKGETDFDFGMTFLPYRGDVEAAPQNSIIGGATLWVLRGQDPEVYEGVAEFFKYLSSPDVQVDWHESTGYVPITYSAYERARGEGFYDENPGADIAIKQLTYNEPTPASKGLRLGNFVQIRDVLNEELEAVWSGEKGAREALDSAVERGNALLRKFERTAR
ncbi:sn-glycerol-3-phosphate ABC transporter substrate-binding protein UgpB [Arhodomonas aquaeolei]|uniref:sn-glycerol-3-phosphate ABC transporter substrate-binding protein UgpB n=1 Tax=Arhodomonas aquaeolei TaxID=2369 RepID=UPI002169D631|nr:sn-glycerol-3-phosphate ABC transporter substrate-binding protein UgpB [Arhodomonas aquaeolei]MCS4505048.1 sn-glycerol-3-phosphate ABC transporter substrate-binding protein UgpB [Arhodomonas aquaeolei]